MRRDGMSIMVRTVLSQETMVMSMALVFVLRRLLLTGAVLGLLIGTTATFANLVNPNSSLYAEDTGAEFFSHSTPSLVLEIFDLGELHNGGEFGFYFIDAPGTLIQLFDVNEISGLAGGGPGVQQLVAIDFINGYVEDVEDAVLETAFTPSTSPIGFYYRHTSSWDLLHTQASLNPSGADAAGVFPFLTNPGYLLAFEDPASGNLISLHSMLGLTPLPEPGSALLLALPLLLVWRLSHRGAGAQSATH